MQKKLPAEDKRKQAYLQIKKGKSKPKVENVLTKKFPDMKDFPTKHHISIFEPGSLIGEDDTYLGDTYSTTVSCSTKKGTLLTM